MNDKLQKYVKLAVNVGVNIQKGQKLLIRCPVDCAYFARMAMEEAYKAGAQDVQIQWGDEISARVNYLLAPDSNFGIEVEWEKARVRHMVDEGYNMLVVYASDPEILKGVDIERIQKNQKVAAQTAKPLRDKVASSAIQWCLISVPTAAWAKKVFPSAKSDDEAMTLMWDAIYAATRVDDDTDAVQNWQTHIDIMQNKAAALMAHNFKHLRFKNSLGTDLEMALPEGHIWVACGEEAATGHNFVANIPTEEVFTAPLRTGTNGIVYATKPYVYMGDVIEGFWFKFKDGKVVDHGAKKGGQLLQKMLTTHPNADYLGEVALVPHSSPISQSGILWYNTLYDENASCHLALGNAYPYTVKGAVGKTEDELNAMGVNQSLSHEDFMMGSADMSIIGVTHDGKEVAVFKQGEWAI
ncbi:MAG: aminopeptidase [Clostridiales bacterium]|jgi:aminopeptidase|nr:aminopeptidase [Clostridiales bacterium]